MSQNLYNVLCGFQRGSVYYLRQPIYGMMGQFLISSNIEHILNIGFESTLFNLDRCDAFSTFVERNYSLIQYTPLIIGVINEVLPEQYLETVEKVYDLYGRVMQALWVTTVGWGLIQSIRYRLGPQTCFYVAAVAGCIFSELYRSQYLSENNYRRISNVMFYSTIALEIYLDINREDKVLLVTGYVLSKLISNHFQSDRLTHYKEVFIRYFIASRQMRQAGLFVDPMTHLVDSFDPKAVDDGTRFLQNEIYQKLSREEKKKFDETDAEIIYYILSRAVYIYAFGEKSNEEIPNFFKEETRNKITGLRSQEVNQEMKAWLGEHFTSLDNYDKDIPDQFQTIRTGIVNLGVLEGRGGMLMLKCWGNVSPS